MGYKTLLAGARRQIKYKIILRILLLLSCDLIYLLNNAPEFNSYVPVEELKPVSKSSALVVTTPNTKYTKNPNIKNKKIVFVLSGRMSFVF
jgi:hypothetical protein